jgi:hypothetical protein
MARLRFLPILVATAVLVLACSPAQSPPPSASTASAGQSIAPTSPSPSADVAVVASPTPTATPLKPPPAPKGVKLTTKGSDPGNVGYDTKMTLTVSWASPTSDGTQIRVFGVEDCMPPPGKDPAPCLTKNTPLPPSARKLVAKAPAAKGKVTWTWPAWEDIAGNVASDGHTTYASIVVAAYNAAGHSRFVIVQTGEFCSGCTY